MSKHRRTRREFIRAGSALAGLASFAPAAVFAGKAAARTPEGKLAAAYKYPNPGKIVIVEHPDSVLGYNNVNESIVQQMFDAGIMAFTGITSSPSAALASLFPGLTASKKIAIKPNLINSTVPTRKEVVKAVINRLTGMLGGFPAANITLYERHSFSSSGYTASYFGHSVNLVVDSSFPNLGYTIYCDGANRPYSRSLYEADYLINMPVAKDHSCSAALNFTFSFKNHMGTVNPGGSLGIHCNKNAVLDIMASGVMTTKQRLIILDALFAIYNGGPGGSPQAAPKKIMIAQDPVTLDAQGRLLINALRAANGRSPKAGTYIDEAAATPYEIGIADPSLMQVVNIYLPVRLSMFTALRDGRKVILRWATEEERNNAGFAVERKSGSQGDWHRLGFVEGAGTTAQRREYSWTDLPGDGTETNGSLFYRLRQTDFDGSQVLSREIELPIKPGENAWLLEQNYPNPFSSNSDIPAYLPRACRLFLEVLDAKGARMAVLCDREMAAGMHYFRWDAREAAPGAYICRGSAENGTKEIQMLLVR